MTPDEDMTVLVVEDERELADTYTRWLADDYTVYTAYDGEEALEAADESVDVVLLDRRLPGMTGRKVLEAIRARGLDCRVAMITAVDPDFDILDMDFDDYVVKPVLREDLEAVVERLLKIATFDDQFQESFSLATKLNVLRSERSPQEIERSKEYTRAKERLEILRSHIDDTFEEFEDQDFEIAYRDLSRTSQSEAEDR